MGAGACMAGGACFSLSSCSCSLISSQVNKIFLKILRKQNKSALYFWVTLRSHLTILPESNCLGRIYKQHMDGCTEVTVVWTSPPPNSTAISSFLLCLLPLVSPAEGRLHSKSTVQVQIHNFHSCTCTKTDI